MDARRSVHIAGVNHDVVAFENALQVELLWIGFREQDKGTYAGFDWAIECLYSQCRLRHCSSPTEDGPRWPNGGRCLVCPASEPGCTARCMSALWHRLAAKCAPCA